MFAVTKLPNFYVRLWSVCTHFTCLGPVIYWNVITPEAKHKFRGVKRHLLYILQKKKILNKIWIISEDLLLQKYGRILN
jgi:hypothetical protein